MKKTIPLMILSLVATVSIVAGCGNDKSVTFKSAGMTHTFSEGGEDIPSQLQPFIYPGSLVAGAANASDPEGEEARFLTLSSSDDLEKVTQWYQKALEQEGWTIDSNERMPRMVNIYGHLKDTEINVVMAEDGEKTTISVSQGRSVDAPVDESELENFTPNKLTPPTD